MGISDDLNTRTSGTNLWIYEDRSWAIGYAYTSTVTLWDGKRAPMGQMCNRVRISAIGCSPSPDLYSPDVFKAHSKSARGQEKVSRCVRWSYSKVPVRDLYDMVLHVAVLFHRYRLRPVSQNGAFPGLDAVKSPQCAIAQSTGTIGRLTTLKARFLAIRGNH